MSELDVLLEEILALEEAYYEVHISDLSGKKRKKELDKEYADDGKFEGNSKEEGRLW